MKKNAKFSILFMTLILGLTSCGGGSSTNNSSVDQSSNNESSFSEEINYGELNIENMDLYFNYPDKPIVTFTNPDYASEITYTILDAENDEVTYENGYFTAESAGLFTVEAKTQYHTAEFAISAQKYNGISDFYLTRTLEKENYWKNTGQGQTGGTVFIGDSFFDTEFFSNFYTTYKGNNAFTNGISSSTIKDWQVFASRLLYPLEPSNIVMHCGTNDVWDDKETAEQVVNNTQDFLNTVHKRLPDTKIYYFAIEPRTYGAINHNNPFDQATYDKITAINESMEMYCEEKDYMVFLDATSHCYTTAPTVNSSFFRDGTHPTLDNYMVYVNLLKDAGLSLNINVELDTTEFDLPVSASIANNSKTIIANNKSLTNQYSISGKLRVTSISSNAHIEFAFGGDHLLNRFLLWDNDSNGSLNIGYFGNNASIIVGNANNVGATLNNEITWQVVASEKHVYFYINDTLQLVYLNMNPTASFMIGAESCAVSFYDIESVTSTYKNTTYETIISREEIASYENETQSTIGIVVVNK